MNGKVLALLAGLVLIANTSLSAAPIIQPGAPGQDSRIIDAESASDLASVEYSEADLHFMQGMISHHWQAVEMSELVPERSNNSAIQDLAKRILASQEDEIEFMADWLRERDESVPGRHHHHHDDEHGDMPGMASAEEMNELEEATGNDFDALFLTLMIEHHKGALTMVDNLLAQSGSAQDPVLYEFANDVNNDQGAEIERMDRLLASLSPDPRVNLAAGFDDAEDAIWNLERITSLPKPAGFHDPENPAGLPMERLRELAGEEADEDEERPEPRPALLSFANSDMAFADDLIVVGNYHGFKLYDRNGGGEPELISAVVCPGGQGDVSVVGDLLIMSVEQARGRLDCGLQGVAESVSEERFRGLRIFDISDLKKPKQVAAVQTCRGSHTHTIVSRPEDENGSIVVYNSATSFVRDDEELAGCSDEPPHRDEETALYRIDIVEIPVAEPESARVVDSPFVFADKESGDPAGLWAGGDHGEDTQRSNVTNHCHDITVFPDLEIAAGACSGNGILFDISDPMNPQRIDEVVDENFAYWHSATFNNDGDKVIFTDEWGGGTRPRCRASDPEEWGADAIFEIVDGKLEFRSYYKLPVPQSEQENCVAHNGSIVPVPGRDLFVQAWYQGGISLVDFTDASNPKEIAFFARGPIDEEELVMGGYWSTYWHQDRIYGTEIARGLDVFRLTPSDYLSENEIQAAKRAAEGSVFNPQKQTRIHWPDEPMVAQAYLDQLARGQDLPEDRITTLRSLLDELSDDGAQAEDNGEAVATLRDMARSLHQKAGDSNTITDKRLRRLSETLSGIADQL
ncbi:uncharacterized protein (DUF305 family) [Natronospira proteinivora]|uniref:Uncharacterized protein (DUF305 family) n=1 Tax=Natronospira proteinivora TaxID=1807133 RepID=A0ABT1GAM2_9GAMM|nr:DUF305 domain-containing protein [Natronospira proteinivora]MCP1728357.1 uncharacterized protein (DUF305 family) [Natronospira proteinivora]